MYACMYVYFPKYIGTTNLVCIMSLVHYVFRANQLILDNQLICYYSQGKLISPALITL